MLDVRRPSDARFWFRTAFRLNSFQSIFQMAERPIFIPAANAGHLVEEIFLPLQWHSGFAPVQKEKNIRELHASAKAAGFAPLLEVSTKSERTAGRHLSAFHLKVNTDEFGPLP